VISLVEEPSGKIHVHEVSGMESADLFSKESTACGFVSKRLSGGNGYFYIGHLKGSTSNSSSKTHTVSQTLNVYVCSTHKFRAHEESPGFTIIESPQKK